MCLPDQEMNVRQITARGMNPDDMHTVCGARDFLCLCIKNHIAPLKTRRVNKAGGAASVSPGVKARGQHQEAVVRTS